MTQKKPKANITSKIKTPQSAQKSPQKETIYVDIDDDITSLVDNVKKSTGSVIAIVLPKNAHVLQSVVNMKLLKRAAVKNKKNIALISTESSVLTLAGVAGVHVAETATSKPYIPTVNIEDVDVEDAAAVVDMTDSPDTEGTIEAHAVEDAEKNSNKSAEDIIKKNKRFKIPDFGSFQTKLFLSLAGIITLVVLWYIGFVVMPRATIVVQTNTQSVALKDTLTLTYSETAEVDTENNLLPAKKISTQKVNEATEQATGEKNVGQKASGSITMSAQVCGAISTPSSVPKGTGVSTNGKTYITQEDASFSFSSFDGSCLNFDGDTVKITAQDSGEEFDTAKNVSFTVAGRSNVSAVGDASGGTTEIVTVVSEEDITNAKNSLGDASRVEAINELTQTLAEAGYIALDATLSVGEPTYSISQSAGDEAASVTVKQTVVYELSGYREQDMDAILNATLTDVLSEQQDTKNVSDNGLSTVVFTKLSDENEFEFSTVATIGPSLDTDALREEFVGMKRGEIIDRLESIDGVTSAEVTYTPMWITTTPKAAKKITIEVQSQ